MAERVAIFEMSPRDGLQNEPGFVPTADKVRLVDLLSDCGFARIEAASFVSPKWVPQMADGAGVLAAIRRAPGVRYTALTPNLQGFERALAARADGIAVFASASEGFSRRNINASIAESLERFAPVTEAALRAGLPVRGYVSCIVQCPYDGPVAPAAVARVARALAAMGCYEISLGDTIGTGTPGKTKAMIEACARAVPIERLAGHFHDTYGQALANI
jgi:hydroxymethylglutaryl-CoA lyase